MYIYMIIYKIENISVCSREVDYAASVGLEVSLVYFQHLPRVKLSHSSDDL